MSEVLPHPPARLPRLHADDLETWSGTLARIYRRAGRHPGTWGDVRRFGPVARGRFDPHEPPPRSQGRGVLYAAHAGTDPRGAPGPWTALAETFQDTRVIDTHDGEPNLAIWRPTRALVLLDLTSGWTTRAGGNQAICSGDRRQARRWARKIYGAYEAIDGIVYTSATYGPGRAVALFDRGADSIPRHPLLHRALADPAVTPLLEQAAAALDYLLA